MDDRGVGGAVLENVFDMVATDDSAGHPGGGGKLGQGDGRVRTVLDLEALLKCDWFRAWRPHVGDVCEQALVRSDWKSASMALRQ